MIKSITAFFIQRSLLVNIGAAAAVILGAICMFTARRVAMPEISLDMVLVQTVYPGASPEEVERNVTRPLEEEIRGISGIEVMYSTSRRGFSGIYIELETSLDNPESTINDIRQAVDTVTDLPEMAESPKMIRLGSSNVLPALKIVLSCGDSSVDIYRTAEELERRLLAVNGVSSIEYEGFREKEVCVELDPERMTEHHISSGEVIEAISASNISYPCGHLEKGDMQVNVSLNSIADSADDVGNITIRSNYAGYSVRVKDVARVYMDAEEIPYMYRANGRASVIMVLKKTESGDNIEISGESERICRDFRREKGIHGADLDIRIVDDISDLIKNRLGVVKNNAIIGLILVVLSLFLLLHWRIALYTSAGLPVAFGVVFIVMALAGITVNMISMVGMILVLGMLVDDAIIVAENTYRHIEKGENRLRAVTEGTAEVALPVTGTILTTIAAFVPLFFIPGMMGKFIVHMPSVVIAALAASLAEAMIVLPVHAFDFAPVIERGQDSRSSRVSRFSKIRQKYARILERAVRSRYSVSMAAVLFLGIMLTVFFGYMWEEFELFPSEGIDVFFITFQDRPGMKKEAASETAAAIEKIVAAELERNELKDIITRIGSDRTAPNDTVFNEGEEYGTVTVYLTDKAERERSADEIIETLRPRVERLVKTGSAESCGFERFKPGPPQGKPVAVQIVGEDFSKTAGLAKDVTEFLKNQEGAYGVSSGSGRKSDEIEVHINSEKARRAHITAQSAGLFLRAAFEGVIASSIRKGEEEIDIRVRFLEGWDDKPDPIGNILIQNSRGVLVPLEHIASVKHRDTMEAVYHKDGLRFIEISPDFDSGTVKARELARRIRSEFDDIRRTHPGCKLEISGEAEKTEESIKDMLAAALAALFLIFIILTAVFNSPFHPVLVMCAVPFGFAGVILAFLLHGETFTFIAIVGVVGMTGVVVNDAIVLVSYIKTLRSRGRGKMESIIEGGRTRLRPVILTSVTTLLGLAPTAYNIGGKDPYLPVIALAVGWGLFFATGVTLFVIPCLYAVGDDMYALIRRARAKN